MKRTVELTCLQGAGLVWLLGGLLARGEAIPLETCVRTAVDRNPGLRAARVRIDAARAAITEARSGYYPRLSLGGSYVRTDNPPQAFMMQLNQRSLNMMAPGFDPNEPDDTGNLRAQASVKYRLFDGGVRGAQVEMAGLGAVVSEAQADAARNELCYQVTRAYYGALQAQSFAAVQEETVRSLEESLRAANERLKAGSAVKTDVLNLEVKLAETSEELIRARNGAKLAVAALNTAIGEPLARVGSLAEPRPDTLAAPSEPDPDAVRLRPELRAAAHAVRIREADRRRAARQDIPVVNAFAEYDMDSASANDFEGSYLVGVAAEWEFFSGLQSAGARRRTRAEVTAAREDHQAALNQLRFDLQQAHLQALDAWERRGVAAKSVESAEEALRITRQRYAQGAADVTELLTAQVGLTATRTRTAAALYDYLTARANVDRACGTLGERWANPMQQAK